MTRMYIQPSFLDSCSSHTEWSGGNDQYRGDKSREISMYNADGSANTKAFSDEAISNHRENNKNKVSIRDKILPQQKRVNLLIDQIRELVSEYKAEGLSIEEYTELLNIAIARRDRAIELLNKAKNVKPKRVDDEDTQVEAEQENVVLKGEIPTKQSVFFSKYKESLVFWGFASIMSIVMLILSH